MNYVYFDQLLPGRKAERSRTSAQFNTENNDDAIVNADRVYRHGSHYHRTSSVILERTFI